MNTLNDLMIRRWQTVDDFADIVHIRNEVREPDTPYPPATVDEMIAVHEGEGDYFVTRRWVLASMGDQPVGFAEIALEPNVYVHYFYTYVAVLPEWRRCGIGTQLIHACKGLAADVAAELRFDHDVALTTNFPVEDEAMSQFLLAAGFQQAQHSFTMTRNLSEAIPTICLPTGIELREMVPAHRSQIFNSWYGAFNDGWQDRTVTDSDWDSLLQNFDDRTYLWQIAWVGDRVVGGVVVGLQRPWEPDNLPHGWTDPIWVAKDWRGRGLAKALIANAFVVLTRHGKTEAKLGVDAANPSGALKLYLAMGYTVQAHSVLYKNTVLVGI